MSKEQTAVDFLFKKLWDEPKDKFTWFAILKHAKKLEKQQHLESAVHILEYAIDCIQKKCKANIQMEFDKYYNETYGDEQA